MGIVCRGIDRKCDHSLSIIAWMQKLSMVSIAHSVRRIGYRAQRSAAKLGPVLSLPPFHETLGPSLRTVAGLG